MTNFKSEAVLNTCIKLTCEGSGSPHRKITWYRLLNDSSYSSLLPITSYWSQYYYYEVITTLKEDQGISSSLVIHKFDKRYEGNYYCKITNGEVFVQSPMINLQLFGMLLCFFNHLYCCIDTCMLFINNGITEVI